MIRLSIWENKSRSKNAIKEIKGLVDLKKSESEVIQALSEKYQEKELKEVYNWIQEVSNIGGYRTLKAILFSGLTIMLVYWTILTLNQSGGWWAMNSIMIGIHVIAIYACVKQTPWCYILSFVLLGQGIIEGMQFISPPYITSPPILIKLISVLAIIGSLMGCVVAYKLIKAVPWGLLRVAEVVKSKG